MFSISFIFLETFKNIIVKLYFQVSMLFSKNMKHEIIEPFLDILKVYLLFLSALFAN